MAAATAATFRSLLRGIPSFPYRSPSVAAILPETKLIPVQPRLSAILRLPLLAQHRFLRGSAAAAYAGTDGYEPDAGEEVLEHEQGPPATKSVPPRDSARLYVGNLPFSMTPAQLAEVFGQAGTVETVEV